MKRHKLASFSPWLFAAACAMLAFIIAVFAVNNYQREKNLMLESLVRQGQTILRFVQGGARGSLRGNRMNIRMNVWQWTDHVQQAIDSAMDQPDLLFLGLVDEKGKVLASNGREGAIATLPEGSFSFINTLFDHNEGTTIFRIDKSMKRSQGAFQVATLYQPFDPRLSPPRTMQRGLLPLLQGPRGGHKTLDEEDQDALNQLKDIESQKYILLAELDLSDFNHAMRSQLLQILFLSLVLLLVGLGGWLSLLTLQGLRGSQTRLQYMRKFNDLLISSLPVGLVAIGSDGRIQAYNQAAEKMTGRSSLQVLGRNPEKVLPASLSQELTQAGADVTKGSQPREVFLTDVQGEPKALVLIALQMMDSENNFAGKTLLIQDISQIKNLQEEVRRNERLAALGKMAAGVAHELRNPLSSIKGLALLLKAKLTMDNKGQETADILINEVERLNRSIGELLEYARPDKLQLEPVQLADIVQQSARLLEADILSAGIVLTTDYQKTPDVMVDSDKLRQVFLNLMLNSIQALEENGRLEISVYEENDRCICRFRDNGCGIKEDAVSKVFDPYFTTKAAGTGLGLAMSAKIIEAHKGQIEISSREGVGTTVRVILRPAS